MAIRAPDGANKENPEGKMERKGGGAFGKIRKCVRKDLDNFKRKF